MLALARRFGALSVGLALSALLVWAAPRLARASGGWARIQARGYVVVGVPVWMPPFGAPSVTGAWQGLDVVLAHALAAEAAGGSGRVRLMPLSPDQRLWALGQGAADAVAAGFAAPAGAPLTGPSLGVVMVGPYFTDALALLVRRRAPVPNPRALDGEPVGVLVGGRGAAALAAALGERRAAVQEVPDAAAGLRALAGGRLRALVLARSVALALADYDPALAVQAIPGLGTERYWLLVPAGDLRLVAAARRAVAALPRGRALQERLRAWGTHLETPWEAGRMVGAR